MSQVLVPPPMSSLTMPVMEVVDCILPQQQSVYFDLKPADAPPKEERKDYELEYLASQHHTSEYNRLKFGSEGAPGVYLPLTSQRPTHVRQLKARQAQISQRRAWWPANESRDLGSQHVEESIPQLLQENDRKAVYLTKAASKGSISQQKKPIPTLNHSPTLNLQRELSMAMSSSLSVLTPQLSFGNTLQQNELIVHAKTSESHPINISAIVPFELLPLITSHLDPAPPHVPQMFELPPSLHLHYLIAQAHAHSSEMPRPYPFVRIANGGLPVNASDTGPPVVSDIDPAQTGALELRCVESMRVVNGQALQPDGLPLLHDNPEDPVLSGNQGPIYSHWETTLPAPAYSLNTDRPHSAPPLLSSPLGVQVNLTNEIVTPSPPPLSEVVHAMSSNILSNVDKDLIAEKKNLTSAIVQKLAPAGWSVAQESECAPPLRPALGNILLSSCPGKKVRLSGPVKGRGAICRDLGHDLRRVKALGVGCIICCLDDEELEFLGAPWSQYYEITRAVGIDVLRIPMPEGLTPTHPAAFDQQLSYIIHSYTLQGIPVLVHCRGGVGRAGLVACCWLLKLGLCGWTSRTSEESSKPVTKKKRGRKETVELVEKVISVVRRRRSVKAIETYEQVRFLVDFVEYMEESNSGLGDAGAIL